MITPRMSTYRLITMPAFGPITSLRNSTRIRSTEIFLSNSLFRNSAASVSGSICIAQLVGWPPSVEFIPQVGSPAFAYLATGFSRTAANRSARIMRSASSWKRLSGSPTVRMIPAFRSSLPPNGSTMFPLSSMAMALMVKSRLARSSSRFLTNRTLSGCRLSEYSPSLR